MAHFAELDKENKVIRVLVVDDENESRGAEYLSKELGLGGNWVQTSYTGSIRGKFAGIGDFYDKNKDEFIAVLSDEDKLLQEAIEAKMLARQSAVEKLKALGLTDSEISGLLP